MAETRQSLETRFTRCKPHGLGLWLELGLGLWPEEHVAAAHTRAHTGILLGSGQVDITLPLTLTLYLTLNAQDPVGLGSGRHCPQSHWLGLELGGGLCPNHSH